MDGRIFSLIREQRPAPPLARRPVPPLRAVPDPAAPLLATLRAKMADFSAGGVEAALRIVDPAAVARMSHPIGTIAGADLFAAAYAPLHAALPDLERRDAAVVAGTTADGAAWIACRGAYTGTFSASWLGIRPTGRVVALGFHEHFRVEDGRVVAIDALWDVAGFLAQVGAWPLGPLPGALPLPPAPDPDLAAGDGRDRLARLLADLARDPATAARHVHPHAAWHGDATLGARRGPSGWRVAVPADAAEPVVFGDRILAAAWPDFSPRDPAALGLPADRRINLRRLDLYRLDGDRIREAWSAVDLVDALRQSGIDVFARLPGGPA